MSAADFDARLATLAQQVEGDAAVTHRCAGELRTAIARDPRAVASIFDLHRPVAVLPSLTRAVPTAAVQARAAGEVDRGERGLEGDRAAIAAARRAGRPALENALAATRSARERRNALCGATTALAAMRRDATGDLVLAK